MSTNDRIVLRKLIEQMREEIAPELPESSYFEFFVSEQVLKNYDLSYEELDAGIVANPMDGGIDSLYAFVDGTLITDDVDLTAHKRHVCVELVVIQSKTTAAFAEAPLTRFRDFAENLLDLDHGLDRYRAVYAPRILETVGMFRNAWIALARKFPRLVVRFVYASQGDIANVNAGMEAKAEAVRSTVSRLYDGSTVRVEFLGARELYRLAAKAPATASELTFQEVVSTGDEANVCLVNLHDYWRFITDETGELRTSVFESNVRDYQGMVEVNTAIQETLENDNPEDFWWLNNGITVLATRGQISGKTLTVEDAQVVNGLQTSRVIDSYFRRYPDKQDRRNVLVRVIVTDEALTKDRIIRATNSQTSIPSASLHATDEFQRMLETFFKSNDLYYERRKNHYKNQALPKDKIISIPYLAQAVVAIVLGEPNNARARPSSLLKRQMDYNRVFSKDYPLEMYLLCAQFLRTVDAYLRAERGKYSAEERGNLRFHLAMCAAMCKAGKTRVAPGDVFGLDLTKLPEEHLEQSMDIVVHVFRSYRAETGDSADKAAKSPRYESDLLTYLSKVALPAIAAGVAPVPAAVAATVPGWESPLHRFFSGRGELVLGQDGPAFTIWEAILHFDDDQYPIRVDGQTITKSEVLLHAGEILSTDPSTADPWLDTAEKRAKVEADCQAAGWPSDLLG